jgi:hypothetical protein
LRHSIHKARVDHPRFSTYGLSHPPKWDTRVLASWEAVKAHFDDRVITVRAVSLESGQTIPVGTHGFVIEAIESPESYEVEFDLETGQILATVRPNDVGLA